MAQRGGTVARDGVGAREAQGGLKYQRARVTTADDGEASPCYGGLTGVRTAGAADVPGVRRAHGAGTAAWPARLEAP
jgi:NCAIR mutase (PurE)-related protein